MSARTRSCRAPSPRNSSPRAPRRRSAFTLVELLVVITIIGMLMAMLVPATSQVRDIARRMTCGKRIGSIATGIITYAGLHKSLPCGVPTCMPPDKQHLVGAASTGNLCQGPVWAVSVLPFLNEKAVYEKVSECMQSNDCGNVTDSITDPKYNVGTSTPGVFLCDAAPAMSDNERLAGDSTSWGLSKLAKGNYAACFGAGTYADAITKANEAQNSPTFKEKYKLRGAFQVVRLRRSPPKVTNAKDKAIQGVWKAGHGEGIQIASIGDGDTHTIMLSEVIGYDSGSDGRGVWASAIMGGSIFTAKTPPNANGGEGDANNYNDRTQVCDPNIPGNDPYHLKCVQNRDPAATVYAAARSGHLGGVNVAMCDSSVQYFSDQVDPEVWKNRSTINGREPNVD